MTTYSTSLASARVEIEPRLASVRMRLSSRLRRGSGLRGERGARALLERGVTLVEVMIVVAIMAMVAGGVALVVIPKFKEAQIKTTISGAQVIRQAVAQWQLSNSDCPTVSQLVQQKLLDKGTASVDPWGNRYQINCENDEVTVSCAGPDKKSGTPDDIIVPKPSGPEEGADGKQNP